MYIVYVKLGIGLGSHKMYPGYIKWLIKLTEQVCLYTVVTVQTLISKQALI